MIDLHAHSTRSDGTYTPTALIELGARLGLRALALTDHDTVSGVSEARVAADRLGIRFIPGVELEVDHTGGEFHLLGLGLTALPELIEGDLREMKRRRERRNLGIIDKMRDDGVEVDLASVAAFAEGTVVGRPHFARFLVERGIADTLQDAFDRFLGHDQRYYLPIEHLTVEECAEVIRRSGGRTVIAHPLSLGISTEELERRLPQWKEAGIEGIEAYHTNAPLAVCRTLEEIARRHGLFVTAGSDFHGTIRPDRALGRTADGIEISERFLEFLPN